MSGMPQYVGLGTKDRDWEQKTGWRTPFQMIPIHELLNRIRWDSEFAKGSFKLGYYDRAENRIILVPLKEVTFSMESPSTFELMGPEGHVHGVPFHRVREVYKNAQRIWNRPDSSATETE
jgi:uncharacterized protein (UPF0248 family)